jgi:hypothetical protein
MHRFANSTFSCTWTLVNPEKLIIGAIVSHSTNVVQQSLFGEAVSQQPIPLLCGERWRRSVRPRYS